MTALMGGLFLSGKAVLAQKDPVVQRIFLVGDAGELKDGKHPVCDWLKQHVDWNDSSNVLLYLGDNVYPLGVPRENSKEVEEARQILEYQVSVVRGKNGKVFFVPGNHDWKRGRPGGLEQLKNESDYIDSLNLPNVQFLPKSGCPGPVAVSAGDKVVLVFMDSQWWLDQEARPGPESSCDCKTEDDIVNALKDIISTYPDKLILLAMHHAFYTHGEHGGYFKLRQHLFPLTELNKNLWIPLPVLGSIYPIARGVFGNIQDTRHPIYKDMIEKVEAVMKGHPNVVHVSGHEHTLQLLEHDSSFFVVSGAGSKTTQVKMGKNSLFARQEIGFAVIEVTAAGKSTVKFYTPASTDLQQSIYAASFPPLPPPEKELAAVIKTFPDSVTVTAAPYFAAGGLKKAILGANYRKEWATPIRIKVFDMTGWTPLQRGGGKQTKSLRLMNKDGVEYVFRGVEKFVTDAALPTDLQGTFVKDIVSDGVSSSYPYAALSIPPFAEALQVPHAHPQLVYVPDDPRLGRFRSDFAGRFSLFEEREPGNGKKTDNTDNLDKKLQEDNDNTVDQKKVLQARLLDMFVMDFDRHEDQWRWASESNGKGKTFYPVPRDRDQPFFINEGILPWLAGSAFIAPQLQGFRAKARNIRTYNANAKWFDRNYMNELSEEDWRKAAETVVNTMTDTLIEYALKLQPKELHSYSMSSIIAKLKERRKYYVEEMISYYKFLAEMVTIYGSDKRDLFDILRNEDGSVTVTVSKLSKDGEAGKKLYERKFLAGETKEIRLFGLGGDDKFVQHGKDGGSILVRIIGGAGSDVFDNASEAPAGKTRIYDLSKEKNQFTGTGSYRSFLSEDPAVNAFNKRDFKYNVLVPFLNVGYNPDDGLFLGAFFQYTTQGFRKNPYSQLHRLAITHALATKAYNFKYNFEAIDAIGKTDLLFNAEVQAPDHTINFFRYGNETIFDKTKGNGIVYYRARFDLANVDLQVRIKLAQFLTVSVGPTFQYFKIDSNDNKGRFINQTGLNGLDPATLYKTKSYAGGTARLALDNRNDKILTSRGINWQTVFNSYKGLGDYTHNYSQLKSELSLFTSFDRQGTVVIGTRVGWGKNFGKYEFFQAQYLNGTENLRGYRKYRFAGDEMFYHNLDLRLKLGEFKTYLFPGAIGLLAFNDVGRVWVKGEHTDQWHDGYGGGLWIAPLKKSVVTISYAQGTDGGLALISWGYFF